METIYKYCVASQGDFTLEMPAGAEILDVQVQKGIPQMWALVEMGAPTEKRKFTIFGTGFPMPEAKRDYIGTFQMHNGALVWHLFEIL